LSLTSEQERPGLRRCLGPLAVTAQAVGTVGLTLTAVINIPQVAAGAGHSTALCYAAAFAVILLVSETLVLFQHQNAGAEGIAGYVRCSLGVRLGQLGTWTLLLGYGATLVACLAFLGFYLHHLLLHLGLVLAPALCVLLGGLLCLELARRDVRLSTRTMLVTESISVLIVLGLCLQVLQHGGVRADLAALNPAGDSLEQLRSGLMAAVLSFIGFESAATLGAESLRPQRAVPQALRRAVLLAGGLFLVWAVVLSEGLSWLAPQQRNGLDPISLLADQLGQGGAGDLIKLGALLCLLGTCIGCLTALGRVTFALAQQQVLPAALALVHPRFRTPDVALWSLGLPSVLLASGAVARGMSSSTVFNQFGAFSVLGFLLVYGLVAAGSLRRPLRGISRRRRLLVGGSAAAALLSLSGAFLSGLMVDQQSVLILFLLLLALGTALVLRSPRDQPSV
jgi:amino acid transporter